MEKIYSTLDVYVAAWIYLYTGIYPQLINHFGKISLNFPFDEKVASAIFDYNAGMEVPASKYALTIKALKAQIFQLKGPKTA